MNQENTNVHNCEQVLTPAAQAPTVAPVDIHPARRTLAALTALAKAAAMSDRYQAQAQLRKWGNAL